MARSLAEWLEWQQLQHPRAIDLGLERVRGVAQRLGLLPVRVPVAIVGGTNGKGSTATTLASLLQAAGVRTGLFTSPHLVRYNERIWIDGVEAGDQALCSAFERIEAVRAGTSLTFFEYNALAALEVFARGAAGAVVLEVGLGGRLDATNIVDADVAVLCSVGMDHMDWLGDTPELIAREKAGIFRSGRPVVLGTSQMPAAVFAHAADLGCELHVAEHDFHWSDDGRGWRFSHDVHGARRGDRALQLRALPPPRLAGTIQYRNAATALEAWCVLHAVRGDSVAPPSEAAAAAGLRRVSLAGRMQVVDRGAEWILDVAHNPPAAEVLAAELHRRPAARRTLAVFGMLGDKDVAGVARHLDVPVDEWLLCPTDGARGLDTAQVAERMGAVRGERRAFASVAAACEHALRTASCGDRVLVCGSFHVVGPALHCLGL